MSEKSLLESTILVFKHTVYFFPSPEIIVVIVMQFHDFKEQQANPCRIWDIIVHELSISVPALYSFTFKSRMQNQ